MSLISSLCAGYSRYRIVRHRFLFQFLPYLFGLPVVCLRFAIHVYLDLTRTLGYGIKYSVRRPNESVRLAHKINRDPYDAARFMVRLARRVCENKINSSDPIDIVLFADIDADVSKYMFLPYLWTSHFNVHVVNDNSELVALLRTFGPSGAVAQLTADIAAATDPVTVDQNLVGGIRLPALFMNQGREFMKAHDWAARYCGISLPGGAPIYLWREAFRVMASTHPNWRFLALGINSFASDRSLPWLPNVIVPGRSGLGFLSQLAISIQVDAFLGAGDVYGLSSVMAGVQSTLLLDQAAQSPMVFAIAGSRLRYAPPGATIIDELTTLLNAHEALVPKDSRKNN